MLDDNQALGTAFTPAGMDNRGIWSSIILLTVVGKLSVFTLQEKRLLYPARSL
jgi:hypothetical protein